MVGPTVCTVLAYHGIPMMGSIYVSFLQRLSWGALLIYSVVGFQCRPGNSSCVDLFHFGLRDGCDDVAGMFFVIQSEGRRRFVDLGAR